MSLQAKVKEIKESGVIVKLEDDRIAWLPKDEITFDPNFDFKNENQVNALCGKGKTFPVIIEDWTLQKGKKPIVSKKLAEHDPWTEKVGKWKEGEAKIMQIKDVASPRYGYGEIEPGIGARFSMEEVKKYFGTGYTVQMVPLVGDLVAGIITKIDPELRLIDMDITKYLEQLEESPQEALQLLGYQLETPIERNRQPEIKLLPDKVSMLDYSSILIVDDNSGVLYAFRDYLRGQGYSVAIAESFDDAEEILKLSLEKEGYFDLAIIDVHLTESLDDYNGITFARSLQKEMPNSKIVLITAESTTEESNGKKIELSEDLKIVAYIHKPIGQNELRKLLTNIATAEPRQVKDFFSQEQRLFPKKVGKEKIALTREEDLKTLLGKAINRTEAESAVLFSIHPITYEVNLVAWAGKSLSNFRMYEKKLRYSPVRDVCIDGEKLCHNDTLSGHFGKHRFLLKTFTPSEKRGYYGKPGYGYGSCIAQPVQSGEADPLAYGVFVFHSEKNKFDPLRHEPAVENIALMISMCLQRYRRIKVERENNPYFLAGMSFSSVSHDLLNALQGVDIDIANIEQGLKLTLDEGLLSSLEDKIKRVSSQYEYAISISNAFNRLAKAHEDEPQKFSLDEIIRGAWKSSLSEAKRTNTQFIINPTEETHFGKPRILERVFFNLFLNAAQQIALFQRGKGYVNIVCEKIQKNKNKEYIKIVVGDTGPGIHYQDYKRVFHPGFTTKPQGSGMGLHICKKELEDMGGEINIEQSILYVGTSFEILLPLSREVEDGTSGKQGSSG